MEHSKLTFRIPYPMLLHIEDNQIYQPDHTTDSEIEEETKKLAALAAVKNEYDDLSIENSLLHSEAH